jgi:PadR family transcriptional regulator, regulatory protein PadR
MCDIKSCGCHDHHLKIEGFIVPCILFLLDEKPAHGYELMEKLNSLAFVEMPPDPSMVYRHLRHLEKEGKVKSKLEPGSGGPARKVYSMTADGKEYLHLWAAKISSRLSVLQKFLDAYEKKYGADEN